jgi:hypothetical protein
MVESVPRVREVLNVRKSDQKKLFKIIMPYHHALSSCLRNLSRGAHNLGVIASPPGLTMTKEFLFYIFFFVFSIFAKLHTPFRGANLLGDATQTSTHIIIAKKSRKFYETTMIPHSL